ncbi:hypothetical protein [Stieleria varia]|uniref:hypothetical protein n=1 Tax=Stieleria varia TaxID=2528005 RepID=UPI0011B8135E|nr:hypothetical protein [Stieleria varia]
MQNTALFPRLNIEKKEKSGNSLGFSWKEIPFRASSVVIGTLVASGVSRQENIEIDSCETNFDVKLGGTHGLSEPYPTVVSATHFS